MKIPEFLYVDGDETEKEFLTKINDVLEKLLQDPDMDISIGMSIGSVTHEIRHRLEEMKV